MSKYQMLTNASPEVDFDVDLDDEILDEEILGEDAASLAGLDYVETDEDEVDGLGYVGLGRARRARKGRARRSRRAKARRARRARRSRRSKARRARKARASRPRRRRKARRVRVAAAPKATKRRRSRRRRSAAKTIVNVTMPKVRRARRRRSAGRRRMSGLGTAGFGRALGKLADTVALQSISGLGKAGKKRKSRRRKGASRRRVRAARRRRSAGRRKMARKSRRKGARRARRSSRRMSGLGWGIGSLGRMGASLADAEVKASWPIAGPFQYAFSAPGLEALGGVTLAGIVQPLLRQGVFARFLPLNDAGWKGTLSRVASVATSAVVMWELGRLLGSGNLAKFGAFYAIGRGIEEGLTKPYVVSKIPGLSGYGLGQARIPDQDELRDLGYLAQARIPDQDELRGMGQRIVTEEELLGVDGVGEGSDDEESNVF